MGFLDKLKRILTGGTPEEEALAPLMGELDDEKKQLFLEYRRKREGLQFKEATETLQTLLTKDSNEKHKEFYRSLIEEMQIYLQKLEPKSAPKPQPICPPVSLPTPHNDERSLCKIGIHKWGKASGMSQPSSNVTDWKKKCERCGKVERWVEPWKPPKKKRKGWD